MKLPGRLRLLVLLLGVAPGFAAPVVSDLMPAPAALEFTEGRLAFTADFRALGRGADDGRVQAGLARMLRRLEARSGLTLMRSPAGEFLPAPDPAGAALVI